MWVSICSKSVFISKINMNSEIRKHFHHAYICITFYCGYNNNNNCLFQTHSNSRSIEICKHHTDSQYETIVLWFCYNYMFAPRNIEMVVLLKQIYVCYHHMLVWYNISMWWNNISSSKRSWSYNFFVVLSDCN